MPILLEFALVLAGKVLNLGVVFFGGVLLARTAGQAEYGVFAIATTWVLLGDGFIGGPFDLATVRFAAIHPGDDERIRRFEAFSLQLKLFIAGFAAVLAWTLRSSLAARWPEIALSSFPVLPSLLALAGLLVARSTATALQNRRRFRLYAALDFAQGIVRSAAFLWLHSQGKATGTSFMYAYGLAAMGVAAFGCLFLGQKYLFGRWPSQGDSVGMLRYCGYAAGIVILATLTGRGDVALLSALTGAAGAATYALASQIAQLVAQAAMYASILTQPRVLRFHREGRLRRLALWNLVAIGFLALAMLVAWDSERVAGLFSTVFGPEFATAGELLRILALGVLVDWLIVPVVVVFSVQDSPGKSFASEAAVAVLFLGAGSVVLTGTLPTRPDILVAWLAVLCRVAKMGFYGLIFLRRTKRSSHPVARPVSTSPGPPCAASAP